MENYGATIEVYGGDCVESELRAREVAILKKKVYVSPYNDPLVIAGQGTIGFEIKDQCDGLDVIIIS